MKAHVGSRGVGVPILNLGIGLVWVVNPTPRSLKAQERGPVPTVEEM